MTRLDPLMRERSGTDPGPASTVQLLHDLAVAGAHVDSAVRQRLGLNPTDYQAVKHLIGRTGPIGPVQLSKLLGISSGSATGLVDRLERDGHVERRPYPGDRRRQTLVVSPATAAVITEELQPLAEAITDLESSFSPSERRVIERFLSGALNLHLTTYE